MTKQVHRALVLGLGDSGESAALLLAKEGTNVTVVDKADTAGLRTRSAGLAAGGISAHVGVERLPSDAFDLCVVSPGVPVDSPWMREIKTRGIPVLPEMELGWRRHRGRTLAVTGTNGKSTVVKWLADALNAAGQTAIACGNYGYPVCSAVAEHSGVQWLVVEASSFQLETVREFRPDVGVLLNLLPNHLDRHPSMDEYAWAKSRLFAKTRTADVAIAHAPHVDLMRRLSGGHARWVSFGEAGHGDYRYAAGNVTKNGKILIHLQDTYFGNDVLGCNAAGAIAALEACGVRAAVAEESARVFKPLPHRMNLVRELEGVRFVNDSKATTLTALAGGLLMCPGRVRLIAGGLLKENDLAIIKKVLAKKASALYLIGQASRTMFDAWSDVVRCVSCETLERAVAEAWRDSCAGETVLLSPGCASFDQFRNYAERGDRFEASVRNLAEK